MSAPAKDYKENDKEEKSTQWSCYNCYYQCVWLTLLNISIYTLLHGLRCEESVIGFSTTTISYALLLRKKPNFPLSTSRIGTCWIVLTVRENIPPSTGFEFTGFHIKSCSVRKLTLFIAYTAKVELHSLTFLKTIGFELVINIYELMLIWS